MGAGTGIVTQARLDALRVTLSFIFQGALARKQGLWWGQFATQVPSDSGSNVYPWIAQQLALRKWKGKRIAQNLSEHVKELFNEPFEGTIEIDRDKIEDDKLEVYANIQIPQLAEATRLHPQQLIRDFLQTNGITWDGKALFANDHPNFNATGTGATTIDNDFASLGDLTEDNVFTIWAAMASYLGEDGKPLNVMPRKLWVPPQLWQKAKKICESDMVAKAIRDLAGTDNVAAAGESNGAKGLLEPVVITDFANQPNTFYIGDDSGFLKPLVYQLRRAPDFQQITRADSDSVFDTRKYKFGVDYRCAVGETMPWLISRGYKNASPD